MKSPHRLLAMVCLAAVSLCGIACEKQEASVIAPEAYKSKQQRAAEAADAAPGATPKGFFGN